MRCLMHLVLSASLKGHRFPISRRYILVLIEDIPAKPTTAKKAGKISEKIDDDEYSSPNQDDPPMTKNTSQALQRRSKPNLNQLTYSTRASVVVAQDDTRTGNLEATWVADANGPLFEAAHLCEAWLVSLRLVYNSDLT
eukprot:IDg17456t1